MYRCLSVRYLLLIGFCLVSVTSQSQTMRFVNQSCPQSIIVAGERIETSADIQITGTGRTIYKIVNGWTRDGVIIPESLHIPVSGNAEKTVWGIDSHWYPETPGRYESWYQLQLLVSDKQALQNFPEHPSENTRMLKVCSTTVVTPLELLNSDYTPSPSPLIREITATVDVKVNGPPNTLIKLVMGWAKEGNVIPESLEVVWTGFDGSTASGLTSTWLPTSGGNYTAWLYPAAASTDQRALEQFPMQDLDENLRILKVCSIDLFLSSYYWQKAESLATPPRFSSMLAYDPVRDQALLLIPVGLNMETWLFSNNQWKLLNPAQSPAVRRNAAMVYMTQIDRYILFGGYKTDSEELSDTWMFDPVAQNWSKIQSNTNPPPNADPSMVYDELRDVIVLVGNPNPDLNDAATWEFDGSDWTRKNLSGIGQRQNVALAYDPLREKVILHGGFELTDSTTPEIFTDTWEYDGNAWTRIKSSITPEFSSNVYTAYMPELDGTYWLGNTDVEDDMEGWLLSPDGWERADFINMPRQPDRGALFYQPDLNRLAFFIETRPNIASPESWFLYSENRITLQNNWRTPSPARVGQNLTVQTDVTISGPQNTPLKLIVGWTRNGVVIPESVQIVWSGSDQDHITNLISNWTAQSVGEYAAWLFLTPVESDQQALNQFPNLPVQDNTIKMIGEIEVMDNEINLFRIFNPTSYLPDQPVNISLRISPDENLDWDAIIIEETIPAGLSPLNISHNGSYIASRNVIRWFWIDQVPARVSYTVIPEQSASTAFTFYGEAQGMVSGDYRTSVTLGDHTLEPFDFFHPLDFNKDNFISSKELLQGAFQWTVGMVVPSTNDLLIAAAIWRQGGSYDTDSEGNYHPIAIQTEQGISSRAQTSPTPAESDVQTSRKTPQMFHAGEAEKITILIQTNAPIDALAVEETLPPDWSVSGISHEGHYDSLTHTIRWFLLSNFDVELTYTLTPASNAPANLQGVASWVSAGELKTINIVSETQVKEWSVY
ncbi:MAG: Kelch repeat-containing protein [bacterium]|jgi:hypothetical protein